MTYVLIIWKTISKKLKMYFLEGDRVMIGEKNFDSSGDWNQELAFINLALYQLRHSTSPEKKFYKQKQS